MLQARRKNLKQTPKGFSKFIHHYGTHTRDCERKSARAAVPGGGGEGGSRRGWKSVTERREARERRLEQE